MKSNTITRLAAVLLVAAFYVTASHGQINSTISAAFNNGFSADLDIADSSGALIAPGNDIKFMSLKDGSDLGTVSFNSFESIADNFDFLGSASIFMPGHGGGAAFNVEKNLDVYLWFLDTDTSNASNATAWAVVHDESWVTPDQGLGALRMTLNTVESRGPIIGQEDLLWGRVSGNQLQLTAVPEPATMAGIGIGVLILAGLTYRRRLAEAKRVRC